VPTLPDVLRAHAFADARSDLVAGYGSLQEFATVKVGTQFRDCD
jgi:hypothetical protein